MRTEATPRIRGQQMWLTPKAAWRPNGDAWGGPNACSFDDQAVGFRNPHSSGWVKDGRHSDVVHVLCSALQRSSGADLWGFFRFFCLRMLSATSQMFRGTPAFNVNIGTWNTASTTCMEIVGTASSVPRPNSGDVVTREWCGFLLAISRIR